MMPRTGTHFLGNLLCLHPDCVKSVLAEDMLIHYAHGLADYAGKLQSSWEGTMAHHCPAKGDDLLESLGHGLIEFLDRARSRDADARARQFDRPAGTINHDRRLVTKSPSVNNLELFFRLFPQARLLVLIRNGPDAVESFVRSFAPAREMQDYEKGMVRWVKGARTIVRFRDDDRHRQRPCMIVRYEDLHLHTEREMRRVLAFLELAEERYDFDAIRNVPVVGSSSFKRGEGKVHWLPVRKTDGFDPLARANCWPPELRARFEEIAGAESSQLGYTIQNGSLTANPFPPADNGSGRTLRSDTILQRAPGLSFDLDSGNCLRVSATGETIACGQHGLAILEAFAHPRRFSDGLSQLSARGRKDWMDLSSSVVRMFRAGVLYDAVRPPLRQSPGSSGYGAAPIHIAMLADRQRTEKFIAGIRQVVRPGDVVVDIGTGSGVLAVAAAQAGAARVYAIEASRIADVAQAVFAANHVDDRVTLIRGWSTQIELPERADVMISEIIGHEPLDEHLLEITLDARRRLLKPDARLVPGQIRVFALPITIPQSRLQGKMSNDQVLADWQECYGVDFSPLAQFFRAELQPLFKVSPQDARGWQVLANPVLLAEFDLGTFQQWTFDRVSAGRATQAGLLNGALIFFEAQLGSITLSTHPSEVQVDNHWHSPVWWFDTAWMVQTGEEFGFRYQCFHNQQGPSLRLTGQRPSDRICG